MILGCKLGLMEISSNQEKLGSFLAAKLLTKNVIILEEVSWLNTHFYAWVLLLFR